MSWGNEGRRDRPATTTAATHSLDDWGNPVSATPNSPANGQLSGNDNEHAINSHGNQNSSGHPNADIQTAPIATQWNENIDVEDSSGGPDAKGGDKTHLNNDGNGDTMGAPPRERAERPQRAETEIVTIEPPADGWAHNAARYEWDDTYGDVAPRHEKLEALLFKDPSARSVGIEFHSLMEINVTQESVVHIDPVFKVCWLALFYRYD